MFKKIISYLPIKRKPAGEEVGEIESITIYPLKSGKGITVNAAKTTNSGLKLSKTDIYDSTRARRLCPADENNVSCT
ncbi:hypothetical protein NP493_82g01012 [Ridgeia piscesae]|uniref:Uncharacterized protein n=1 Tax=Ridgeia piscesae TaxID=27915 RepID=A0AAD9P8Z3_RIDPI|nr:hypothetical protein NP493_82g01012 [Ridgeia piscesae]